MSGKMNRRDFLKASALAAAGVAVAACAPKAEPTTAPEATKAPAQTQATATPVPVVRSRQGIPHVGRQGRIGRDSPAGRAPARPTPWSSPSPPRSAPMAARGTPRCWAGPTAAWIRRTHSYEPLLRWAEDLTETIANVASGWEVKDGGKEFVFSLRKGIKWSDGEPFTADDFVFWWEDEQLNTDIASRPSSWMRPGGEVGAIEKVDDVTVAFKFAVPNGLFVALMGSNYPFEPAHYNQQFHVNYNKDAVEKAATDGQFQDWAAYYSAKTDYQRQRRVPLPVRLGRHRPHRLGRPVRG